MYLHQLALVGRCFELVSGKSSTQSDAEVLRANESGDDGEGATQMHKQTNQRRADFRAAESAPLWAAARDAPTRPEAAAEPTTRPPARVRRDKQRPRDGVPSGPLRKSCSSSLSSSFGSASNEFDVGNKCGKCQNHEIDLLKKGKWSSLLRLLLFLTKWQRLRIEAKGERATTTATAPMAR